MVKIKVDLFYITRYNILAREIVINWIDFMNIIFKKWIVRRSYPNIHLHINYARSFKKSASILTNQETQMVDNDQWPPTTCYTEINRLHERCLPVIYNDGHSSYDESLNLDNSVSIQKFTHLSNWNVQGIHWSATDILNEVFPLKPSSNYNLRNQ